MGLGPQSNKMNTRILIQKETYLGFIGDPGLFPFFCLLSLLLLELVLVFSRLLNVPHLQMVRYISPQSEIIGNPNQSSENTQESYSAAFSINPENSKNSVDGEQTIIPPSRFVDILLVEGFHLFLHDRHILCVEKHFILGELQQFHLKKILPT